MYILLIIKKYGKVILKWIFIISIICFIRFFYLNIAGVNSLVGLSNVDYFSGIVEQSLIPIRGKAYIGRYNNVHTFDFYFLGEVDKDKLNSILLKHEYYLSESDIDYVLDTFVNTLPNTCIDQSELMVLHNWNSSINNKQCYKFQLEMSHDSKYEDISFLLFGLDKVIVHICPRASGIPKWAQPIYKVW